MGSCRDLLILQGKSDSGFFSQQFIQDFFSDIFLMLGDPTSRLKKALGGQTRKVKWTLPIGSYMQKQARFYAQAKYGNVYYREHSPSGRRRAGASAIFKVRLYAALYRFHILQFDWLLPCTLYRYVLEYFAELNLSRWGEDMSVMFVAWCEFVYIYGLVLSEDKTA
ncbi:hypothetical protein STEG23_026469 [Scotinomys teguina]